jgi:hypothetical protein
MPFFFVSIGSYTRNPSVREDEHDWQNMRAGCFRTNTDASISIGCSCSCSYHMLVEGIKVVFDCSC